VSKTTTTTTTTNNGGNFGNNNNGNAPDSSTTAAQQPSQDLGGAQHQDSNINTQSSTTSQEVDQQGGSKQTNNNNNNSNKPDKTKFQTTIDHGTHSMAPDENEDVTPQSSSKGVPDINLKQQGDTLLSAPKKKRPVLEKGAATKLRNATLNQMKYFTAMTSLLLHHINQRVNNTRKIAAANRALDRAGPTSSFTSMSVDNNFISPPPPQNLDCSKRACTSEELREFQLKALLRSKERDILPNFFKPKLSPKRRERPSVKGKK